MSLRAQVGGHSAMPLTPLVQLLGHHSGRVKMRAAKVKFAVWQGGSG